jgi:medium-chain acyl-[acyl-carrier-protein] hydrolase
LFCLPYAGGGASVFRVWPEAMPAGVELSAVQLPGHEARIREPPVDDLGALVRVLADEVAPLAREPYALFGHSMGAEIAFQLARELRRRGARAPARLFVGGRGAPHCLLKHQPILHLSDAEFLKALVERYNGIPQEVLDEPELVALILPALRADLRIVERYEYVAEPPLECPISAYGGTTDAISPEEDIRAWRSHTAGEFEATILPGGHFFLNEAEARKRLLGSIATQLLRISSAGR